MTNDTYEAKQDNNQPKDSYQDAMRQVNQGIADSQRQQTGPTLVDQVFSAASDFTSSFYGRG